MWHIVIDVSGMYPDDIYVGLVLFNDNYKPYFLNDFYREFPNLRPYNAKSTRLDSDTLFGILKFFDEKRLRMVCYHFRDFEWKKHERRINELYSEISSNHKYRTNLHQFREKIIGILYFYAITQIGIKNDEYHVTMCSESNVDIWTISSTIKFLAKKEGWKINTAVNIRKIEHLLKMADYVAGANRKVEEFKLKTISRHILLKDPIKDIDLKRVFHIWKN